MAIGHADSYAFIEYHRALVKQGAYVQFENIGHLLPGVASLESRLVPILVELVLEGWSARILLSQDICHRSHFKAYGGSGYDYVLTTFRNRLRSAGIDDESWPTISVDNPRRLLTGE